MIYPVTEPKPKPISAEELPAPEAAPVAEPQDVLQAELDRGEETKKQERTARFKANGRDADGVLFEHSETHKAEVAKQQAEALEAARVNDAIDFAICGALWGSEKGIDYIAENKLLFNDPFRFFQLKAKAINWGLLKPDYKAGQPIPKRPIGQERALTDVMKDFNVDISSDDKRAVRAAFGYVDNNGKKVPPVPGFAQQLMRDSYSNYCRIRELKLGPTRAPQKALTYRPDAK